MIIFDLPQSSLSLLAGAATAGVISAIRSGTRAKERQLATCEFLLDRIPSAMTDADFVLASEKAPRSVRLGVLLILKMMHDEDLAKAFLKSIGESKPSASSGEETFGQQLSRLHVDEPEIGAAAQRAIMTGVIYLATTHSDPRIVFTVTNESATNPDGIISRFGQALKSAFRNNDTSGPGIMANA